MAVECSGNSTTLPLLDRVAIVTGSSGAIGGAVALHFASLGAKLVVNYSSNSANAQEVVSQINSAASGGEIRAIAVQADVSKAEQVKALFDAAESAFQTQPHIVVTLAGILDPKYKSIADTAIEDFDNIFSTNARGAFLCCREAARRVQRGGGGRIIVFSTSLTAMYLPGFGAYTASKATIEAMTKILAKELRGTHITVNCVAPGPVATKMFFDGLTEEVIAQAAKAPPFGRLGEPQDIVPLVGFLATDGSEWINGQVIRANGGFI